MYGPRESPWNVISAPMPQYTMDKKAKGGKGEKIKSSHRTGGVDKCTGRAVQKRVVSEQSN